MDSEFLLSVLFILSSSALPLHIHLSPVLFSFTSLSLLYLPFSSFLTLLSLFVTFLPSSFLLL